jgi:hypothetical protein
MYQKILEILKERKRVNITEFHNLIPESKGEFSMYMPVNPGNNPNILWMGGINNEFTQAINKLMVDEKLIDWEPVDLMIYLWDGSPIYANIPIVTMRRAKGKKPCWMPIVLKLK